MTNKIESTKQEELLDQYRKYYVSRHSSASKGLTTLPDDVLLKITSYLPGLEILRMQRTCKILDHVVAKKKELCCKPISNYPMFQFFLNHSSLVKNRNSHTQNLLLFHRYVETAKMFAMGTPAIYFQQVAEFLRSVDQDTGELKPLDPKLLVSEDCVRKLIESTAWTEWGHFFLAAVLLNDESLIASFDLKTISRPLVDCAAYLYLSRGKIDLFNELLPHTSLYDNDVSDDALTHAVTETRACDLLREFLLISAKENQMETFKKLKEINVDYDADLLLYRLANHDCGEAIGLLLAEAQIDNAYIPGNGQQDEAVTFGLHTALMDAANRNNLAAFEAILQARPGEQIDRSILEHILDLFQNHGDDRGNLVIEDWQLREDNPNRGLIIQRLTEEIAARYPETDDEIDP